MLSGNDATTIKPTIIPRVLRLPLADFGRRLASVKLSLDQVLTTIEVDPQVFSVCRIQAGWRMIFPVFKVMTVHFVLRGSGYFEAGTLPPIPFSPSSVLIAPAHQGHWVGEADSQAMIGHAADQCALLGDGLVEFTAGSGAADTLMLCGALPAPCPGSLGLFDLLPAPVVTDAMTSGIPDAVFDAMANEIGTTGLATQAMCQALMKQGLVALLRNRWERDVDMPSRAVLHPRLSRAVVAIATNPAGAHTVASLASLAGMSRASFSDHFAKAFGQGPIDYVQKARLRVAARLLHTTDLPIKVIAQSAGYAGPRSFSRAFQMAYKCRPAEYRENALGAARMLSARLGAPPGV